MPLSAFEAQGVAVAACMAVGWLIARAMRDYPWKPDGNVYPPDCDHPNCPFCPPEAP